MWSTTSESNFLMIGKKVSKFLKKSIMKVLKNEKQDTESISYFQKPFYKIYNYPGPLKIKSVDKRGLIDFELRIFYNRIPKAGNSTIVSTLTYLKYKKHIKSDEESLKAKTSFLYPSQLTQDQSDEFYDLFKFTIVRNPYTRILSAYLDKIISEKKYYLFKQNRPNWAPSFYDFCIYLKKGGLYHNIHWAPQTEILLLPVDEFNFIGHLETLDEDFMTIFQYIQNVSYGFDIKTWSPHKTNANKKTEDYYDEQTMEIVAQLYESDFKAFNYDPNKI